MQKRLLIYQHRFGPDIAHTRSLDDVDEGNNNGLEGVVRTLERIYTKKDATGNSPSLDVSLRWPISILFIYFSLCICFSKGTPESHGRTCGLSLPWWPLSLEKIQLTSHVLRGIAAQGKELDRQLEKLSIFFFFRIPSRNLCLHNFGEPSCSVTMPRPFKFQTGRADCVEVYLLYFPFQLFFPRETQSLVTRRPKKRFTRTPLATVDPPSSSSETPLPWPAGRWSPWWALTPLASHTLRSACSRTPGPARQPIFGPTTTTRPSRDDRGNHFLVGTLQKETKVKVVLLSLSWRFLQQSGRCFWKHTRVSLKRKKMSTKHSFTGPGG